MEQIINVLGKRYMITSDGPLTQEQINTAIKKFEASGGDLKTMAISGICQSYTRPPTPSGLTYCRIRSNCTGLDLTGDFECWNDTKQFINLINAGKCPANCPPQYGIISFTSTPSGAEIYIDGIFKGVTTPNTISSVLVGTHIYDLKLAGYYVYTGSVSVAQDQTISVSATLTPAYREAALVSCGFPVNAIAGQTYQVTITVNQGSLTENYKLVFSGDLAGESIPFTVNAGTGQQQITVGSMMFTTGGPKTVTAALVKI